MGSPGIVPAEPSPVSVTIPASPFMQKLGFGTGVSVYLMKRLGIVILGNPGGDPGFLLHGYGAERGIWEFDPSDPIPGYRALTTAPDGSLCLAMEFGGEKSLNDLIPEVSRLDPGFVPALNSRHSRRFPLQYLHTEQRLLHGDIKSPNVVVRGAFESVKICDVGVSLPLDENLTGGTPGITGNGGFPSHGSHSQHPFDPVIPL
nr:lymphokine-activated killer T-cell-originated protein kinase [Zonotrichia albicollis]